METALTLSLGGFPPFSARGCTQKLTPLQLGQFFRTIDGQLIHTHPGLEKKYHTLINCSDQTPPATDHLVPGCLVTVGCIQRIWQKWDGKSIISLEKIPIANSIMVMDQNRSIIPVASQNLTQINVQDQESEKTGFISYRPLLSMRLIRYVLTTKEWDLSVSWEMELEEV